MKQNGLLTKTVGPEKPGQLLARYASLALHLLAFRR